MLITKENFQIIIDRFSENIEYYKNPLNAFNETSCRLEYIDKLLLFLGWDVYNSIGNKPQYKEVVVEKYEENMSRPDYTLTLRGISKLFVEAKKPSVDILHSDNSALQTRKYGWNANHKIAILTNFEYLVIYDTKQPPLNTDSVSKSRYKIFHYSEYITRYDEIKGIISKDIVYSGEFDSILESSFELSRTILPIDKYFLSQMNNWRVSLAKNLVNTNYAMYSNLDYLDDEIQRFINKLIFLRICEDRNISTYHQLKSSFDDIDLGLNKLNELFKDADARFNSGIFSGQGIMFDLNNLVIYSIIKELYYPESPYLFNIIEPSILGKIYELFITEKISIIADEIVLLKKKDYVDKSIISTPIEIVRTIVKNVLDRKVNGLTPSDIIKLRFADISCGSGVFLVELYSQLQEYCVEWYEENEPSSIEFSESGFPKLTFADKRKLLINCMYGVDIDLQAVEVSKFSLLIKLLEGETSATLDKSTSLLPKLDNNILFGNSLVNTNVFDNDSITLQDEFSIVPFSWTKFNDFTGFDVIVGNPPYVNTEGMYKLLSPIEIEYYKENYQSAYKQFDKYFLFVERSIQLLKDNGVLGFIIPNKFMKINSGIMLREILVSELSRVEVFDFGDTQLFEDKTTYTSLLFASKMKIDNSTLKYNKVSNLDDLLLGKVLLSGEICVENIANDSWSLHSVAFKEAYNHCMKSIINFVDIFNGIQTSAERPIPIYWFSLSEICDENDSFISVVRNKKTYHIEKSILRPYFKPTLRNQKGYTTYDKLSTDKFIIFPYDLSGNLIDKSVMIEMYPKTWEYLMDCYSLLVPKQVDPAIGTRDVPNSTHDTWYQYGRTQALTSFNSRTKIIVRILSDTPMYSIDEDNMLIASGGTAGYCAIAVKESSPYSLEYIQAWLNSEIIEELVRDLGSPFENGFYSRGTSILNQILIYPLDLSNKFEEEIHRNITESAQHIRKINTNLVNEKVRKRAMILESKKQALIDNINDQIKMIFKLIEGNK